MTKHLLVDFGEVISAAQPETTVREMAALAKLSTEEFRARYWASRPPYDLGQPAHEYWEHVFGRPVHGAELAEIRRLDLGSWTHLDFATIDALRSARQNGARLTLLSNAPHDLADAVGQSAVLKGVFDLMLFSAELRLAKPSREIFDLALALTEWTAEDTLFIDDRLENLGAAEALGIRTHRFTTAATLADELRGLSLGAPADERSSRRRRTWRQRMRDRQNARIVRSSTPRSLRS